jgi:hypothetical protein
MNLGFLDAATVVGKLHRWDRIDLGTIDAHQLLKMCMHERQERLRLRLEKMVHLVELLQGTGVHRLKERAATDAFGWGDVGSIKFVLFQDLQELTLHNSNF